MRREREAPIQQILPWEEATLSGRWNLSARTVVVSGTSKVRVWVFSLVPAFSLRVCKSLDASSRGTEVLASSTPSGSGSASLVAFSACFLPPPLGDSFAFASSVAAAVLRLSSSLAFLCASCRSLQRLLPPWMHHTNSLSSQGVLVPFTNPFQSPY